MVWRMDLLDTKCGLVHCRGRSFLLGQKDDSYTLVHDYDYQEGCLDEPLAVEDTPEGEEMSSEGEESPEAEEEMSEVEEDMSEEMEQDTFDVDQDMPDVDRTLQMMEGMLPTEASAQKSKGESEIELYCAATADASMKSF